MVFLVAVFFFRKLSFRVDGDTVSVFWKSCIALPDEMASAPADRAHETATGELQDQTIAVNGDLSSTCVDEDSRNDLEQAKKTCGAKKVSDLNGIAIASQTCHSPLGNENHFDSSNESKYERSITSVTSLEEKQVCEQAGPADPCDKNLNFSFVSYESERQMSAIMALITKDLSEPYSIYTYRYFIHNWPKLCFLAMYGEKCVGAIVCKLDMHKNMIRRGYIAMLAVEKEYRRHKIGSNLVIKAIKAMVDDSCDEVVLETEVSNTAALRLYENLGFVRDKRLFRYYLNGVDALRLKLWLR
ncbi:N-alpha-acetyltransferase 30 [Acropora cervicornis]|uniref:N-terminal methionine N(alpha)-acetyltransferase NatC n=1 Tax=Acropora cervicornis TaxID=6130 RepID=A0AAD9QIS9_ACRCE|nr:N-alpha-acetyltransferase 30 [Acropora cervicornis]